MQKSCPYSLSNISHILQIVPLPGLFLVLFYWQGRGEGCGGRHVHAIWERCLFHAGSLALGSGLTLDLLFQECQRTRGSRIQRNSSFSSHTASSLRGKAREEHIELKLPGEFQKPDSMSHVIFICLYFVYLFSDSAKCPASSTKWMSSTVTVYHSVTKIYLGWVESWVIRVEREICG